MEMRQKPSKSVYDGLSIELDPIAVGHPKARKQNPSEIAKYLVVKNGKRSVQGCQVGIEELAYHFRNEWIFPPNGYEQKALRWAEGSATQDGKKDIYAHGSARIEIVRLFRFPNPFLGLSYFDGTCGKTHHLIGTYKLRLCIEAETIDGSRLWRFEPIIYEVYLNYAGALDAEIIALTRMSAI